MSDGPKAPAHARWVWWHGRATHPAGPRPCTAAPASRGVCP